MNIINTNPAVPSPPPVGHVIVDYTGVSSPDAFTLAGLYNFQIFHDTVATEYELVAGPGSSSSELGALVTGAQSIWFDASGVVFERFDGLRGGF